MNANAQVSFLSDLALLPRLLPALQALIRTSRPESLQPDTGKVIGARSGGIRDYVNHIAHLVHSQEPISKYSVHCRRITKSQSSEARVRAARFGPLAWLQLLGAAMSLALLILSITRSDGFALVATLLLSFLSSIIGFGSRWRLVLAIRTQTRRVPEDNIVIQYSHGAFLVIKCDEQIARELYWHPEECNYTFGNTTYRVVSLVGTMMLMFGVICLGNSTLTLQIAFAAAYMILNAAYWTVAALPKQWHWDLSCYYVEEEKYEGGESHQTFTQALWKAIAITGSVDWVKIGQVAPVSEGWKSWVNAAGDVVEKEKETSNLASQAVNVLNEKERNLRPIPKWDAEGALTDFLDPVEGSRNV